MKKIWCGAAFLSTLLCLSACVSANIESKEQPLPPIPTVIIPRQHVSGDIDYDIEASSKGMMVSMKEMDPEDIEADKAWIFSPDKGCKDLDCQNLAHMHYAPVSWGRDTHK